MLIIKIIGQNAERTRNETLISDAINFIQIQFEFDSSWDGLNKTYQFSNGDVSIDVTTNDTLITVPHEVLIQGELAVKVKGTMLDETGLIIEQRATMNPIIYQVMSSELVNDADNNTPATPEVVDQIRAIAEGAKGSADNALEVVEDIKEQTDELLSVKEDVLILKTDAQTAANTAKLSEDNAKGSEDNASGSEVAAMQALSDLLAMMGTDIATLTGGKLTPSQIPAIAVTDTFVVNSEMAMLALYAQTGDVCIRTDESKSYILQGSDPAILANWQRLQSPTNYADAAGHAATADEATNAGMINGHRVVTMTQAQYDSAVKDPDTIYLVGV